RVAAGDGRPVAERGGAGGDRDVAARRRWFARGEAGAAIGQRQRLYRAGIFAGFEGARTGAPPDQAALPGRERGDRAVVADAAGGPGRRGTDESAGGPARAGAASALVQRGATAQRVGLLAAGGCVSRQPGGKEGGTTAEAGAGPAPPPRKKTWAWS